MHKTINTLVQEVKSDLINVFEARMKLIKLSMVEKGSEALANLKYGLVLAVVALTAFGTLSLTAVFWIAYAFAGEYAEVVKSIALGFSCFAGLFVLLILILLLIRKSWVTGMHTRQLARQLDEMDRQEAQERAAESNPLVVQPSTADATETNTLTRATKEPRL